ncbi:MAG: RIP metalloprotease RseP [Patescibacteria group bacterium]
MSYVITAIVFILIFSFLILIHELGHFIMAKRAGIKVEEFGFGLPPRLWGKKKGETIYSINWIPFGGFVRMYGEDQTNSKFLKNDRSFASKSMRARTKVVVAGVVMNFLVAYVLLVVGFSVGMPPLVTSQEDVMQLINDGQIVLEPGLKVEKVLPGSLADKAGFKAEDVLYAVDDKEITNMSFAYPEVDVGAKYTVMRDGQLQNLQLVIDGLPQPTDLDGFGLGLYDSAAFPRVKVYAVDKETLAYKAGIRAGDVILTVNDKQVFDTQQYETLVRGVEDLDYKIYRNGEVENFIVEQASPRQIIVSEVVIGSPAQKAGLVAGDVLLAVNGKKLTDSQEFIKFVQENKDKKLALAVSREGKQIFYEVVGDKKTGLIGVVLSELMNYQAVENMSLYSAAQLSTVAEIKDQKYPIHVAMYKSFGETYRLSKQTAQMFGNVLLKLVRFEAVPEGVGGPVGIYNQTAGFIEEGFVSVLVFVAMLSLSLAVINILPIPALDGGRLLFIFVEFILGRKINQKLETRIHLVGYALILLLIIRITYNDIAKLFS